MPDLQTDRAYRTILRKIGTKLRTGLSWGDRVQPVAIVDNLEHLLMPIENRHMYFKAYRAATPGFYSVCTVIAGRGGFWFRGWNQNTVQAAHMETRPLPATGSMTIPITPPARWGDVVTPLELQIAMGSRAAAPDTFSAQTVLYAPSSPRVFVPPSWCLEIINFNVNSAQDINVYLEEIVVD